LRAAAGIAICAASLLSSSALAESYTYDSRGRLASVTTDDGKYIQYAYDDAGNRVTVGVTTPFAPPTANAFSTSTPANAVKVFDPRTSATSATGLTLSMLAVSTPQHGTASTTATAVTYTPTNSYVGADSFTYTVQDSSGGTATGNVSISVTDVAPTANPFSTSTPANLAKTFDPRSAASSSIGLGLTLSAIGAPAHGTATSTSASVTYTPTTSYVGPDSFSYTVIDGQGGSATSTVNVTVTDVAPTAGVYSTATAYNTAKTFDPRTSASSPIGLALTLAGAGTAAHGTTSSTATSVTYTPTSGYSGADTFSYTVSDGKGGTATSSVNMTVQAPPAGLTVSVAPVSVSVTVWYPSHSGVSPTVTATPSGGSGTGYTYLWQYVSGDTVMTVNNASNNATAWSRTNISNNSNLYTAVWRCKVTDSAGNVAYSPNVSITFDGESTQ
jgi:YD repeat-containing protein